MYKIGDFSRLAQVTVRTLRHYDKLGLLRPGQVDHFTNYRYYTADQLPRLNRILALRDLGFSLEQIGDLLKSDMTVDQMQALLTMRQAEIEQQLREESTRLRRVATRLRQIEQEGAPFPYDVVVKSVPAVSLIVVRDTVPDVAVMGEYRGRLLSRLYRWLDQAHVAYGQEIVGYHNRSYTMEKIEMSIGVEVAEALLLPSDTPETIRQLALPAAPQAASIVHSGSILDLPDMVSALYGWLGMNNYTSAGPYREIHLFGRELDAYANRTVEEFHELNLVYEILVPIERF